MPLHNVLKRSYIQNSAYETWRKTKFALYRTSGIMASGVESDITLLLCVCCCPASYLLVRLVMS